MRNGVRAMQFLVVLIVATVVSGAAGTMFALKLVPANAVTQVQQLSADDKDKKNGSILAVYDLPAVVTNIGSPSDVWVRLEGSMIFDPREMQSPEAIGAVVADDLLAYLRTVSLQQIQGPVGLQALRQELNDRVAVRTARQVKEFVLRTLVVQ